MKKKKKKKSKLIFIFLILAITIELFAIVAICTHRLVVDSFFVKEHFPTKEIASTNKKTIFDNFIEPIQPKKTIGEVEPSYFDDALFIGDSRTVGLRAFGELSNASYFAKTGISTNSLFTYPALDEETNLTLSQTLASRNFGKIYIMIGINDICAISSETFLEQFSDAINKIREYQPNAIIYIQSIIGVTRSLELSNPTLFDNSYVHERNLFLKDIADGEKIIFLDLFSNFIDDDGYLNHEYSSDGIHLNPSNYKLWCDFLLSNALK